MTQITNTPDTLIKDRAYNIAKIASDHKGFNIRICDLGQHCTYAGYFILVSGTSSRQTNAIADAIAQTYKVNASSVEGRKNGEWVLVDLGDIIVHVFDESSREQYMFDRNWSHVDNHLYVDPDERNQSSISGPSM